MCGISGIIGSGEIDLRDIRSMTNIIRHRGPDDEGYLTGGNENHLFCCGGNDTSDLVWSSDYHYTPVKRLEEFPASTSGLAFGHRRLSILDLSPAGHQPMSYSDGRYWITFNGEIYNFLHIRNELQKLGYPFISGTDTEVVLAAYAEWGKECLDRFAGMWAFVIYDHILKEIFLGRDRYGIKPLYYWFSPAGHFHFASEIKQFTVLKSWQSRINPQMVYDQLVYSFTDHTDETMFSGVYQLPPGSCFKSALDKIKPDASGRINYHKWYSLKPEPFRGSFNEAAEGFKEHFERSVREHLYADVPVGTALSGGLDSSAIVCEVNRILRNDGKSELQKTFSSCSIDERYDEKKWMDIIIDRTRVDARFVFPNLKDVFELTPDIIWQMDEPYQSLSALFGYNVFRLANTNGVKVLLNGQGADEYLGGYGQFTSVRHANMLKQLRIVRLINDIKNLHRIKNVPNSAIIKGAVSQLIPSFMRRAIGQVTSSSDNIRDLLDINKLNLIPRHPHDAIRVKLGTIPEVSEHYTFYSPLPKYLRWEDRNSMAHSVEARVPFLDHRLVEFTYNLPDDFLERDGVTKRVMREALSDLLPEKIKNRKDKMGFTSPEELWIWVKQINPALFRQKISEAVAITDGIIKPGALTYFDKLVDGKAPLDYTYWRLFFFSEWVKKFQVKI
jgi:asparagine synthase (glutamine-hydrolysing)